MRIIKDTERQMNLHPQVVYFVLSSKMSRQYGEAIKQMNRYSGFTRGLFKFHLVSHIGRYSKSVLSTDLQESMKRYNMMVRLMDDAEGNYYYALHQVNFNQPPHLFEASIRQFITDVCSQNLIHLDERLHSISASSKEMSGRREAIEKMQTAFRQAIEMKHFRKGVWNNLTEGEIPVRPVPAICHENSTIPKVAVDRLRKAGFSEEQAKIATSVLWKLMVSEFNLPSKETSHEVALGTANLHYSSFITKEQRRRQRPANEPSLQIEIKRIVSKILKDGREKKNWGVEIHINGEVFPVNFGSKDRLMIYICSLLRIKLGEHLYIHEFYNNSKGRKSRFKRGSSRKWLKAAFEVLFPSMDRTFDEWIRNIETAKGRPLNQGKTQAANLIEVALDTQPDGIYYCTLYTKEDEAHDSYYHIRIKPEQIIVPQELSFLIDDFYEMTDTQPVSNYHPME